MNGIMNLLHPNRRRLIHPTTTRTWWVALCLLSATPSAFAYDLWQAYQDAQQNDPTYLSSMAQKKVYDAQKSQARAVILPTVMVTGGIYKTRKQFW